MEKTFFTSSELVKIFRLNDRYGYKTPAHILYKAEERGDIPKSTRVSRGKTQVRQWTLEQLPEIGKYFGFIKKTKKQHVISKYIQKGGVLKTTTSFYEAKTFAINGLKTLIIGLDPECSITDVVLPKAEVTKLQDNQPRLGLYNFFAEKVGLTDIIQKTSLPTLDIIPETHSLVSLERWINQQKRREYIFKDRLLPLLSKYDVIIFDNPNSWNHLTENSLISSDAILMPLGCHLLAYNASQTNIPSVIQFQQEMQLKDQKIIMFPTFLDRDALSQEIFVTYLSQYNEYIVPIPIRRSAKGQEALVFKQSILEYAPSSSLANDYYEIICAIWEKVSGQVNEAKLTQNELALEV